MIGRGIVLLAIGQLGIYLIGEKHHVGIPQYPGQGVIVFLLHNAPGGVAGIRQYDKLGLIGKMLFQQLRGKLEAILHPGLHQHGSGPGHLRQGRIAHKGGYGNDDLVSGVQQGPHGHVDGLAAAHGDDKLAFIVIPQVKPALQISADLPAQGHHARVGGILREPLLQGVYARVPDVPRGDKVRLADAQGDSAVQIFQQIEKFTYAGGLNILYPPGKYVLIVHYTKIHSFSCSGRFSKIMCFSLYLRRIKWVAVPVTSSITASFSPTKWATSFRLRPEMMTVRS